jgi:hypothetical protein
MSEAEIKKAFLKDEISEMMRKLDGSATTKSVESRSQLKREPQISDWVRTEEPREAPKSQL